MANVWDGLKFFLQKTPDNLLEKRVQTFDPLVYRLEFIFHQDSSARRSTCTQCNDRGDLASGSSLGECSHEASLPAINTHKQKVRQILNSNLKIKHRQLLENSRTRIVDAFAIFSLHRLFLIRGKRAYLSELGRSLERLQNIGILQLCVRV